MLLLLHKLHNQWLSLGLSLERRGRGGIILHIGVVCSLMPMFVTMSPPPPAKNVKLAALVISLKNERYEQHSYMLPKIMVLLQT